MCQLTPEQREAYEDFLGSDLVHKVHTTYHLPLTAYYSSGPTSCTKCSPPRL